MSTKTSSQSGLLNKYLHELHTVDEKVKLMSFTPKTCGTTVAGGKAVEELDKEMKRKTDPALLKKARHEQRELDYGRGTR